MLIPIRTNKYEIIQPIIVSLDFKGLRIGITGADAIIKVCSQETAKLYFDEYFKACNKGKRLFDLYQVEKNILLEESEKND